MQGNVASRFLIYVVSLIDFSLLREEARKRRMRIYQGTFVKNVLDIFFCPLFSYQQGCTEGWMIRSLHVCYSNPYTLSDKN